MTALPTVLDIEDALERVRVEAGADLDEEIDSIEARLDDLADDRATDREATLDEIDETLLGLEERTEGEAERDVRAARNRIGIYRDSRGDDGDTLFVLNSDAHAIEDLGPDRDEQITATVVNAGDARDVRLAVTFRDAEGEAVEEVRSPAVNVGSGAQRTVEFTPDIPRNATSYAIEARDADADAVGTDVDEARPDARPSGTTTAPLDGAHESLHAAQESASNQVREQLLSIEEGLDELVGGDKTEDDAGPHPDRIEEIEEKLTGLEAETDGETRDRIEDARDHLLTYRRNHA